MSLTKLLAELKAKGVGIRLEGGRPKLIGPKSVLTEALIAELRQHRDEIIAVLTQAPLDAPPAQPCFACGSVRFWQRPSGGWVCSVCHPAPGGDVPELTVLRNLRESLAKAVIELGEAAGWPTLSLDGYRTVIGGRAAWAAFIRSADVPTLRLALSKLKEAIE